MNLKFLEMYGITFFLVDIFFYWFLYITYLALKNLKSKNEFGGKDKS